MPRRRLHGSVVSLGTAAREAAAMAALSDGLATLI